MNWPLASLGTFCVARMSPSCIVWVARPGVPSVVISGEVGTTRLVFHAASTLCLSAVRRIKTFMWVVIWVNWSKRSLVLLFRRKKTLSRRAWPGKNWNVGRHACQGISLLRTRHIDKVLLKGNYFRMLLRLCCSSLCRCCRLSLYLRLKV